MILIDSSVWISLINENDSQHKKALEVFSKINLFEIVVYDYIYSEILTVLKLKQGNESCVSFINMLDELNIHINFIDEMVFNLGNSIFIDNNKLSFVDSIIIGVAKVYGCEVITFDNDLKIIKEKYCKNNLLS